MRRTFFERIFDEVRRKVDSYEGKPVPNDQVASGDRKNIGSVGNELGNVQCGSRLSKMPRLILSIGWEGDEVPGEIGTSLVGNRCSTDLFPVQKCFVQRL